MKINEIARKLNISARAIRFYEEKGLIEPHKQQQNRYRRFTQQDVWRLQTIIALREVGMSLDDIRQSLDHIDAGNKDDLLDYLELQRSVMYAQWLELKQILFTTDQTIALLKENQTLPLEDVFVLAEGSKRLREARSNWSDRWNYDTKALTHDERVRQRSFFLYNNYEEALDLVVRWIDPRKGEDGLDLGTGTGNLAGRFLQKGTAMAAVDQSKEMLKQCQRKFPALATKLGNFLSIPYLDHQFDFVVSSFALHHLTDEQLVVALAEMKRVLKPHGRICIADLMFPDSDARTSYMERLQQDGQDEQLKLFAELHFANLSRLVELFEENGYITKQHALNELLHVLYAVPIRS